LPPTATVRDYFHGWRGLRNFAPTEPADPVAPRSCACHLAPPHAQTPATISFLAKDLLVFILVLALLPTSSWRWEYLGDEHTTRPGHGFSVRQRGLPDHGTRATSPPRDLSLPLLRASKEGRYYFPHSPTL